MNEIEKYYNKFNEDKRLLTRHGQVEYRVSIKYIHDYLPSENKQNFSILDVGAGTGKYSVALSDEGFDVTAVELVKHNLKVLQQKNSKVKAFQGNALNLKKFADNSFDMTLLFGPLYHLFSFEEKLQALNEAKRVTKLGGVILVAYCMNDYAVLLHGFRDKNILQNIIDGDIDKDFKIVDKEKNLYSYVRVDEIKKLAHSANLNQIKIVSVDGASDYMRDVLNKMDEQTFDCFVRYQLSVAEHEDIVGASSHTLQILKKNT